MISHYVKVLYFVIFLFLFFFFFFFFFFVFNEISFDYPKKKGPQQAYFKKYDMPHKERALCDFSNCHIIVEGEAFLC